MPWTAPAEERFWMRVHRPADGCWIWQGALSRGYGYMYVGGGYRSPVHRYAYELLVGPIPDGLQLDHLCRNRACVRPDHLEPVTEAENIRRGRAGARKREQTHCAQGHEWEAANTLIRKNGARHCRACNRNQARTRRAAQRSAA